MDCEQSKITDFGLVSIVMPMFNDARYINDSIQSVLNQSYSNWELLVVDDCSSDHGDEIVRSFGDERILYFRNDINRGTAFSRNFALTKARGKWIAFLDADDIWLSNKLQDQLSFMRQNNVAFCYAPYYEGNEALSADSIILGPRKIAFIKMTRCCYLGCLTVVFNKEIIGDLQVDPCLLKRNDYALWLQASKKSVCVRFPKPLAVYRRRLGGISSVSSKTKLIWAKKLYKLYVCRSSLIAWILALRCAFFTVVKRVIFRQKIATKKKEDFLL